MAIIRLFGFRGILLLVLVFIVFMIGFQNMDLVSVRLLIWDMITIRKIHLILLSSGVGGVVGFILGWAFKRT